ncbi:MAG: hypothetical protein PHG66_03250 [Candidatus Colwellbacteria bacterium]|nr:hypothetical protein [Candidatus Colwellbacteria bacterium]
MRILLIRLSSAFPTRKHLNPLMILIALAALIPGYVLFKETLPLAVFVGASVIAITAIGVALPKKMLLTKWAFYEAAVFTAMVPIWCYLSENADTLGWSSFILMILSALAAGYVIIWSKSR